jgi:ribosomal protein S18 acetylase RimI-like enzyme
MRKNCFLSKVQDEISIKDVDFSERNQLLPILEESFEGIYLWHAKKTLRDIDLVRAAFSGGEPAGLVMLKDLDKRIGYVYYIAVPNRMRGLGIAGKLLDNSIAYFFERNRLEVYSSIEEDNEPSLRLFKSRGFRETSLSELSKKYGMIKSNILRMKMLLVPGEILWVRELSTKLDVAS